MSEIIGSTAARIASTPIPDRMASLPREHRGYAVPRFVLWIDGKPDFRIMDRAHLERCIRLDLCWVCGHTLGRYKAFVVGPMCIINRTSSEPPSHLECGRYAARVCPFLAVPEMRRIDARLPEEARFSGTGLKRNAGVVCLWIVESYRTWKPRPDELLFEMGNPTSVEWWREGREATRAEVNVSIAGGLPLLEAEARKDAGGIEELTRFIDRARQYLPEPPP